MERDFDDIAKRLHDLEADPPTNGWEKLKPIVVTEGRKFNWFQKNWWTPLLLLVPASYYLISSAPVGQTPVIAEAAIHSSNNNQTLQGDKHVAQALKSLPTADAQTTNSSIRAESRSHEQHQLNADDLSAVADKSIQSNIELSDPQEALVQKTSAKNNIESNILPNNTNLKKAMAYTDLSSATTEPLYENLQVDTPLNEQPTIDVDQESSHVHETKKYKLILSVTPVFTSAVSHPKASDEVLITKINQINKPVNTGFSFSVGAGKVINEKLSLDAQLSFRSMKHRTAFSYTTGVIDTLLAIQQTDQSFLITPVYNINEREVSTTYGYTGLQLGFNYTVLAMRSSQLSIIGAASTQFLIFADAKEKLNNRWVSIEADGVRKLNFNMMIGLAYTRNLSRGWDVTMSPALSYYLKEPGNRNLPYNTSRQSMSLTFMLSKILSK